MFHATIEVVGLIINGYCTIIVCPSFEMKECLLQPVEYGGWVIDFIVIVLSMKCMQHKGLHLHHGAPGPAVRTSLSHLKKLLSYLCSDNSAGSFFACYQAFYGLCESRFS